MELNRETIRWPKEESRVGPESIRDIVESRSAERKGKFWKRKECVRVGKEVLVARFGTQGLD